MQPKAMEMDGLFQMQIRPVPLRFEPLEQDRFAASMRTQALQYQARKQPDNTTSSDEFEDQLLERVQRIEEKVDWLLALRLLQTEADESKLTQVWTTLSETQVVLRTESPTLWGLAIGGLVHLKWILPHLPQRLFEGLARVQGMGSIQEGWHQVQLDFEVIHDETRDEIARAAFLSQRLSRRPSASHST